MAAARAARPRRLVAPQVPLSVPARRCGSIRQSRRGARHGEAPVVMLRRRAALFALAAVALVGAASLQAQEPVQASVDRTTVRVNESFTFVLRAEGTTGGEEPQTAPLAAQFDILNA